MHNKNVPEKKWSRRGHYQGEGEKRKPPTTWENITEEMSCKKGRRTDKENSQ